ncbi:ABC transporter permease [Myceligenerans pegani]|uniref:ABC transporter permease n=1 Tax=Myceligenerans pegani TaxID=2776917 RepID=A0ABR9MVX2_9MICO|nr:ABC transporter permease [Myceligenerans sp. TRM 65318]MBE1875079.1 ABC transporter permease [Myceligenerans sp. TRM 65318]MBE3017350.1 ABC transporter permease [Myceligenerans sp. TRM 65318]
MSNFAAAWETEWLLCRRSTIVRLATALLLLVIPAGSVGAVALARADVAATITTAKFTPYASGPLAETHVLVAAQILSVALLMAGGFAMAWTFGQEIATGLAGARTGMTTSRSSVALAKVLVHLTWLAGCVAGVVGLTVAASALVCAVTGQVFDDGVWNRAGLALVVGLLSAGLTIPFGWVATLTRSPLGTIGALIGVVVVTQLVTALGGGPWFPYAAPSLWAEMGGVEAAADIGLPQLLLTAAVLPAGAAATVYAWRRLDDV